MKILFVGLHLLLAMMVPEAGAHDFLSPVNPALGVPGFPHCGRMHPEVEMAVEDAALDLVCAQVEAAAAAIKIGCVGDSITAGAHSSGGTHPYPQQLQILLDRAHGNGTYSVTNLGACGSTMLKKGDSPYWKRPQFNALLGGKWDIVTIMLGTNDAKDKGDHGPGNWPHDCGGVSHTELKNCSFASDFADMIAVVRTLGTSPGVSPKIYAMVPPPLMQQYAIGANQSVINSVYPKLVPLIAEANKLDGVIDIFSGMGGESTWMTDPAWPRECDKPSPWAPCAWWCDDQSCDQCHPNDNGYAYLSGLLQAGLGI